MTTAAVLESQTADIHNPDSDKKIVYVIFNPVSGQTDPEQRKKTISDALARHGYTSQFIATSKEEGAQMLAHKAVADGADLLAVSGGDGTVMEAMAALVGTEIPIAVLPAGTGNLLSINLGIPTTVPDAVDVALSGDIYELDLARVGDGRYFAIMGGIGLDAQVIAGAGREAIAHAICDAADIFKVPLLGMRGTLHETIYAARGHAFVAEFYADLDYADDGSLIITREHHAKDPVAAAAICRRAMQEGIVLSVGGVAVKVGADTICVHSDTPNAGAIASAVRAVVSRAA